MKFLLTCLVFIAYIYHVSSTRAEKSLVRHLFNDYDERVRPANDANKVVNVSMKLELIRILDVDFGENTLTTKVWLFYQWNDDYLTWDPIDYENITDLAVPSTDIWIPDIFLYNNVDEKPFDISSRINAVVQSTGHVTLVVPQTLRSTCNLSHTSKKIKKNLWYLDLFNRKCSLKFGSWVYDMSKIDLSISDDSASIANLETNPEWNVSSFNATRHEATYDCCPNVYPSIEFELELTRNF